MTSSKLTANQSLQSTLVPRSAELPVMCEINKVYQKFKLWYRGPCIPYTIQEMMDLQRDRYDEPRTEHLSDRFAPPLIARIINSIGRFLLPHLKWFIVTIIALGMLIVMILEYCYK